MNMSVTKCRNQLSKTWSQFHKLMITVLILYGGENNIVSLSKYFTKKRVKSNQILRNHEFLQGLSIYIYFSPFYLAVCWTYTYLLSSIFLKFPQISLQKSYYLQNIFFTYTRKRRYFKCFPYFLMIYGFWRKELLKTWKPFWPLM